MLRAIDHVVIYVSNQAEALKFYVGKLGFEVRECAAGGILYDGYWLAVAPAGSQTSLLLALRGTNPAVRRAPIMLVCCDMRRTYDALAAAGVEFTAHPIGGLEWVSFVDPDGNLFHVTDNPSRGKVNHEYLDRLVRGVPDGPLV